MTSQELMIPVAPASPESPPRTAKGRNDSPIFIDLSLAGTALYWTTRWGVDLDTLTKAVEAVGTNSVDVAAHLGLPKRKTPLAA